MSDNNIQRLSVLMSFSGAGGVERMVMNLVREFARTGVQVDLLVIRDRGPHLRDIPDNVRLIPLKSDHTLLAIPELVRYLKREQPASMLVAKDRAGRAALMARKLAGTNTRIAIRLGTNLSTALARKSAFNRWFRTAPMRRLYPLADKVVAVSEGVRQDTLALTGVAPDKVTVIRNPVITANLAEAAAEPVDYPWLQDKHLPVVMGAGRLSVQKDFPTLIKAFAEVQAAHPCRLLILGEGGMREELEALIRSLDLQDVVDMPGFQANLYAWLSKADVFVLSSLWEGSPNVLTEALALGIPSVATRCPSGPDEVLAEGQYGELIPVQDVAAMRDGILKMLLEPLPPKIIREAVTEYHVEPSAQQYLGLFRRDA